MALPCAQEKIKPQRKRKLKALKYESSNRSFIMQRFLSEQTAYICFLEPVVFQDTLGFEGLVETQLLSFSVV